LEFIDAKVKALHPKLKQCEDLGLWQKMVDSIHLLIPHLNDDEIIVEFAKLLGSLHDGHTRLLGNNIAKKWFPIRIEKFSDGYFIKSVDKKYAKLYGSRVIKIGNYDIEEAFKLINELSSGDNPYASTFFNAAFLPMSSILNGLHIIDNENQLQLIVEKNGIKQNINIEAINYKSHPFHTWFKSISEKDVIYVAINQCVEGFTSFSDSLWSYIDNNKPKKLIIDLSKNFGGTNAYFLPFIHRLIQHPELNKKGNLYIVISPNTFSAAVHFAFWLETHCNPIFVGTPTGAGANHYAEPDLIEIPNSKMLLWVSKYQWQLTTPTDKRLWIEPDIWIEFSSEEYFNGENKILNTILE